MFAKATKSRFFAVFAVMMLMLCSVAVIADADASPYGGVIEDTGSSKSAQIYTVDMSVGQTFTYSGITTNLDGTQYGSIDYTWDGTAKAGGITFDVSKMELKGSFATAGEYQGTLTAVWTAPFADDKGYTPTQTATQTINFNVAEKIGIKADVTAYALVGWGTDSTIVEVTYTGSGTISASYTYDKDNTATATSNTTHFTATHDAKDKKITIKPSATLTDADQTFATTKAGPEYINVTLKNGESGDTAVMKVVLYIYDEIAISAPTTKYYTYEGDTQYTTSGFLFSVNYDDDNDATTVVSSNSMVLDPTTQTVLSKDANNYKKVNINTTSSQSGSLTGDAQSKTYTATLTVNGTAGANEDGGPATTSTATATFELIVYRSLEFTSAPKVENVKATAASTGSNNLMTLSANVAGAKYVTINWGDGQTSQKTNVAGTSIYNGTHKYTSSGMYMITITAENDVGTTTSKVMYGVNTSSELTPDTTTDDTKDKAKGFFEEHGYLFLVFILILVGLLVAYFYFGIQHPFVLLLAIVCAVLAVALYVYGDFGGIIDALKGSK